MTALWFFAILQTVMYLGTFLAEAEAAHSLAGWQLTLGHVAEGTLYVMDVAGLIWAQARHLWIQLSRD